MYVRMHYILHNIYIYIHMHYCFLYIWTTWIVDINGDKKPPMSADTRNWLMLGQATQTRTAAQFCPARLQEAADSKPNPELPKTLGTLDFVSVTLAPVAVPLLPLPLAAAVLGFAVAQTPKSMDGEG